MIKRTVSIKKPWRWLTAVGLMYTSIHIEYFTTKPRSDTSPACSLHTSLNVCVPQCGCSHRYHYRWCERTFRRGGPDLQYAGRFGLSVNFQCSLGPFFLLFLCYLALHSTLEISVFLFGNWTNGNDVQIWSVSSASPHCVSGSTNSSDLTQEIELQSVIQGATKTRHTEQRLSRILV